MPVRVMNKLGQFAICLTKWSTALMRTVDKTQQSREMCLLLKQATRNILFTTVTDVECWREVAPLSPNLSQLISI